MPLKALPEDYLMSANPLPLVSIIIPIFNVEKYIYPCLSSVSAQTYNNIEIICVDDQGTDNSVAIVKSFISNEKRIKIVQHQSNLGLGSARNTGISHAKGDFIYFLDSDDVLMPKTIENLVAKAEISRCDIVIGAVSSFPDVKSEALKKASKAMNEWLKLKTVPDRISASTFYQALDKIPCIACGKLYRTTFLRKNNLSFINEKVRHEDTGFHIKCMSNDPTLSFTKEQGYQYRIRSSSLMNFGHRDTLESQKEAKLAIEDALSYLKKFHKNPIYYQITMDVHWNYFTTNILFVKYYWGRFLRF